MFAYNKEYNLSQGKNNIINQSQLDWSDQLSPNLYSKSDVYSNNNQSVKKMMPQIIEQKILHSQWENCDQKQYCQVIQSFDSGLNFLEISDHFLSFRRNNERCHVNRLHVVSFSPLNASLIEIIQTLAPRSEIFNLLKHELVKKLPSPMIGCHRLMLADGQIQLDLWLGDISTQFVHAFSGSHNINAASNNVDAWLLTGKEINLLSVKALSTFSNNVAAHSKANATIRCTDFDTELLNTFNNVGFSFETSSKLDSTGQTEHAIDSPLFTSTAAADKTKNDEHRNGNNNEAPAEIAFHEKPETVSDIAIIGGGIASLCCALSLAERGKKITLYCADEKLGAGASGNLQGALYPLINKQHDELSQLFSNAYLFAHQFYTDLNQQHPFEHEFNGLIQLAYDSSASSKLRKIESAGLPESLVRCVDNEEVNALAGLEIGHEGLFYPDSGWLSPRALITSLHDKLLSYDNITILCDHKIDSIAYTNILENDERNKESKTNDKTNQNKWHLYQSHVEQHISSTAESISEVNSQSEAQAKLQNKPQSETHPFVHEALIIAAGMDTLNFKQCRAVPLSAARGQVSHVDSSPGLSSLKRTLCHEGYLTPSINGAHCMGATFKRHDQDTQYREHEQAENHQKLKKCVPNQSWVDLIKTNDQAHTAIRCTTRDHFPYVGPLTDYNKLKTDYESGKSIGSDYTDLSNAFLLTGLGSRGLCTAPLLGEVIASLIDKEPLPISKDIFEKMEIPRQWRSYIRKSKPLKE